MDTAKTNKFLLTEANRRLNIGARNSVWKVISPFSAQWARRREALLQHVIRAAATDPMRVCTFVGNTAHPLVPDRQRVGRPRTHWTIAGIREMWSRLEGSRPRELGLEYDWGSPAHSEWVQQVADLRL